MAKADNMLAILWLLKSRARMTARELSDELEIHIRTVYRLIDALCMSGVPIVSETGRDGGYHIPSGFKLEPLFFDSEEQGALLHAAGIAREAGYPASAALERAAAKIKRYANPDQLARMERREAQLEALQRPVDPARQAMAAEIDRCIGAQRRIRFRYRSGFDGVGSERTVDPYGLVHGQGRWYVVGHCRLRGEIRSFRVDRMDDLQPTSESFDRPTEFSAREYLLDSLLPDPDTEEGGGRRYLVDVAIRGSRTALDDLCAHWLLSRTLVARQPERAHFRLDELRLYTYLPYYLLSFGGKIDIEAPEALKRHLAETAEDLARHYRA